jgi:hypothetical protein
VPASCVRQKPRASPVAIAEGKRGGVQRTHLKRKHVPPTCLMIVLPICLCMAKKAASEDGDSGGLVIYSKTARKQSRKSFVSKAEIAEAMENIPPLAPREDGDFSPRYAVSVSPSTIRVSRHEPESVGQKSEKWVARLPVLKWTNKSRAQMVERLATLDYSPFNIPDSLLAFVTLTYPGDWITVAPTASHAKKHVQTLRKRFEREFKRPFFAVWKMEFQRRGAPHFHLLAPVPVGVGFNEWLSHAWTDIVAPPLPEDRAKHLMAGTGVDRAKGMNADTPHRISYYFSKHGSANKGAKEYQNRPAQQWVDAGSVGRFWGYWGLIPATVKMEISDEHALFISRTLRRWQRANRQVAKTTVWRTNTKTGVMSRRSVNRRKKIVKGSRAFRLVPDGARFIELLSSQLG